MNISSNNQQKFFDVASHRYPNPVDSTFAQRLEMEHLERTLGDIPGKNIMDFGCGSGRVSFWFLKKGYNVTAVDISLNSLRDLEMLYINHKTPGWGKLKTCAAIPNTKFDAIVGADILHHVNINKYLPRLLSLLKPNSRIAFSEPNALHFPWYIHWVTHKIPLSIERGVFQCTQYNLTRLFQQTGFHDISINGHGLVPTKLLNSFPIWCRFNAIQAGNIPLLRQCAFRLMISATR